MKSGNQDNIPTAKTDYSMGQTVSSAMSTSQSFILVFCESLPYPLLYILVTNYHHRSLLIQEWF